MSYRRRRSSPFLRSVAWGTVTVLVFSASFLIGNVIRSRLSSDASQLSDDVRVDEDSTLTYYLKVKYDGVDRQGISSSDSVVSEVRSDMTFVSDKVPDGLIFQKFVTSGTGSIGAVRRSDGVTACSGQVIDDTSSTTGWINSNTEYVYHGLHYTVADRTVRFKVKNLQAGCQLQVGIETKTPILSAGQNRVDFYNTAGFLEGDLSGKSNTTHHFIGRETVARY